MTTDESIREVLLRLRAELVARAEAVVAGADAPAGGISFGKRVGEGTSIAIERFADVARHGQLVQEIAAVDHAIERLDAGTYGSCERCGEHIPRERLEYVPAATTCVRCV